MVKQILAVLVVLMACPCFAQDLPKVQGKVVVHATVPSEPGWFLTGWSITNIRQDATDNTNVMFGVGKKLENGWIEIMAQRQYSVRSNQWFADFRLSRKLADKVSLFVEIAPFLETKALYDFFRLEYRLGRINILAESENIHRPGRDLIGIGPGLSLAPIKLVGKIRFAPVVVWQMRPNDPSWVRFYFAFPL
jgi:hypothetical protein